MTPSLEHPALTRFFRLLVGHPVGVLMLTVALLGMSAIAARRIPIELVPRGLADNSLTVSADWEGAHPREIEERILKPLEKELRGLPNLDRMYSRAGDGEARAYLIFPGNVDMDLAYAEVSDRVERARPFLPAEVDRVRIFKQDMSTDIPVLAAGVLVDDERREQAQDVVADVLLPRLEAVDGVASVGGWGLEPASIRIWLDEEKVYANRVDVGALVQRLMADNVAAPVGDLDDAGSRTILRVDGRFDSLEEIEAFPVRPGLTIGDVGRVVRVRSAPEYLFRVWGNYSIGIFITKENAANTFALCNRVKQVIEEELPEDPVLGAYEYVVYWNQGETIGASLNDLIQDALIGGAIACVVLFLFLRRVTYTLLIAVAIPFSVLVTLSYLYFTGDTLNLFTMMGITISIGMLVDNAVVIVESIFKRREQGASTLDAVTKGPSEVMLAIVTATCTTVVVFLPLIFMTEDRNARILAGAIGVPLCIALIAALLLSVVIVPVAARFLQRGGKAGRFAGGSGAGHVPDWLANAMGGLTHWTIRHRFRALAMGAAVVFTLPLACHGREFSESGGMGGGQDEVDFDFADGTDLYAAQDEVFLMEEVLLSDAFKQRFPDVDWGIGFDDGDGEILLWPEKPLKEREKDALYAWLREHLPVRSAVEYDFEEDFQRTSDADDEWARVRVRGPESLVVDSVLAEVRARALASEDFVEVSQEDRRNREIRVALDRQKLSDAGLDSQTVLNFVEWNLRGLMVSRFQTPRQDLPIIIEYDEPEEPDRAQLEEMRIAMQDGETPLSSLATFTAAESPASIWRRDGQVSDSIGLKPAVDDMRAAYTAVQRLMEDVDVPPGYTWTQEGGWSEFRDQQDELFGALILSLVLVFLLMGVLFNSWILPLSALFTVPFAFVGAMWALKITGQPYGMIEIIGLIVLGGVVVNNGIVLIDRILQHQSTGLVAWEAIERAVQDRLRPILMTALTTVCGLLPIAVSEPSGNGFSFRGMAIVVIGGILCSTLFTLWIVPLMFSLLTDLGDLLRQWAFARRPRAA